LLLAEPEEPPEPPRTTLGGQIDIGEDERRTLAIPLGNIPPAYADGFSELLARAPAAVPTERWHRTLRDAVEFLDLWGEEAARLGYSPEELFGLDPVVPLTRYDRMGLVWLLRGASIVSLTATEARFSGGLAYRRRA
jgi:hypothetical protein